MDTITAQRIRLEKIAMKHLEAREYPLGGSTPIYDELMAYKPRQGSDPLPYRGARVYLGGGIYSQFRVGPVLPPAPHKGLWARVREWLGWI